MLVQFPIEDRHVKITTNAVEFLDELAGECGVRFAAETRGVEVEAAGASDGDSADRVVGFVVLGEALELGELWSQS